MKNYTGIIFFIGWTILYYLYFGEVLSELGLMIPWFLIWIFLALPWGVLSLLGLVDEYKQNIKLVFHSNKLGKYFILLFGLLFLLWGISIIVYVLYMSFILSDINISQVLLGLFMSFLLIRTGYRIINSDILNKSKIL